jgi:hypothetical protein
VNKAQGNLPQQHRHTALGSQIDPTHTTVRARDGDGLLLAFVDAAAL